MCRISNISWMNINKWKDLYTSLIAKFWINVCVLFPFMRHSYVRDLPQSLTTFSQVCSWLHSKTENVPERRQRTVQVVIVYCTVILYVNYYFPRLCINSWVPRKQCAVSCLFIGGLSIVVLRSYTNVSVNEWNHNSNLMKLQLPN